MRLKIEALLDYQLAQAADLLLAVEVAQLPDQRLIEDRLTTTGTDPLVPVTGEDDVGRRTWTRGQGRVTAHYTAIVELNRTPERIATLAADPLPRLPADVTRYLWPSRYCDADRFEHYVRRRFGDLEGGAKVQAIADWVHREIAYVPGATDTSTMAGHSFVRREGVCRDFAHVLIAMIRAADMPARMVGAYAPGVNPPDFHAVAEVWLAGAWHLIDATGMAPPETIVRIGVGRDATDVSFLTVFGSAQLLEQRVSVERVE